VPLTSRCCCSAGSLSQRSPNLFSTFCSSALSERHSTGAGASAAGASCARARPGTAKCRLAANNAASTARRLTTPGSLMFDFLRRWRRRLGRLGGRDPLDVGGRQEFREIVLVRVLVDLVDPAEKLEQVFVGFRL